MSGDRGDDADFENRASEDDDGNPTMMTSSILQRENAFAREIRSETGFTNVNVNVHSFTKCEMLATMRNAGNYDFAKRCENICDKLRNAK